jgi:hypothetical protein
MDKRKPVQSGQIVFPFGVPLLLNFLVQRFGDPAYWRKWTRT